MSPRAGGWFVRFPDQGQDEGVRFRVDEYDKVSFVVPIDTPLRHKQLCLVALEEWSPQGPEDSVEYIAIATSGGRVSSFDRRVTLSNFVQFERVEADELRESIPTQLRRHFVHGPISPATFDAVLKALIARRPHVQLAVQRIERLMSPEASISSHREEILGQERDSVALALEMSDLPPRTLPSIHDVPQRLRFMSTLSQAIVREDPAIQHDASVFGDWSQLARYQVGAVVFDHRGERVTAINVNRQPVERSLGVDLIYYTHRFDAYVLVQYKSLRREGSEWVYRADDQLKKELARMRAVPIAAWSGKPDDFRLTTEACYIKVCKSLLSTPLAEGLIPGWYLPVSYWDALFTSGRLEGPKGGTAITANTVGRYLNNDQFVEMIARGWLGSRGDSSRWIDEVIRLGLEEGKSIILAAHTTTRGTR